ncbi:hypothetical protein JOE26_001246 [Rhodococcus coprophilus]|uniref:Uncharacterized protein n=1 Tax=Rhodococcus coprophilus TaxID=38310 RepID=A0A2X4UEG2_9NOCA|nr:hypothetical protein [Rhodococcus coprophilus]SQI32892.1 Uncharacterised protein [Rhodococcus coprophilus]
MPRKNYTLRRPRRGHPELNVKQLLSVLKTNRKEMRDGSRNR